MTSPPVVLRSALPPLIGLPWCPPLPPLFFCSKRDPTRRPISRSTSCPCSCCHPGRRVCRPCLVLEVLVLQHYPSPHSAMQPMAVSVASCTWSPTPPGELPRHGPPPHRQSPTPLPASVPTSWMDSSRRTRCVIWHLSYQRPKCPWKPTLSTLLPLQIPFTWMISPPCPVS